MRDRRAALKLSQAELARRIGASRHWVAAVEQGKPRAELGLVLKALDALGLVVDVRELSATGTGQREAGVSAQISVDEILERAREAAPRPPLAFTDPPGAGSQPPAKSARPKSRRAKDQRGGSA